ncbi:MAG: hypothetical protein M3Z24_09880 [Chloroflexota bacterium]|nr:hypothetical protein [Chloroflexota bacterium]
MSFSSKHSYVIPAYKPYQDHRAEPKIAEVLIALTMLVLTVVVVALVLYYLSL